MKATLFYDGRCSLCAGEIQRLARLQQGTLALQDIHGLDSTESTSRPSPEKAPDYFPDKDTLLKTLHLRTEDGHWLVGADANVAAWQHTRLGWLWRWLRWPVIASIVDAFYSPWARWRYNRLYGSPEAQACRTRGDGASDDRL